MHACVRAGVAGDGVAQIAGLAMVDIGRAAVGDGIVDAATGREKGPRIVLAGGGLAIACLSAIRVRAAGAFGDANVLTTFRAARANASALRVEHEPRRAVGHAGAVAGRLALRATTRFVDTGDADLAGRSAGSAIAC